MNHEGEPFPNRDEVELTEQQKAYSKEFLNDIYPDELYPEDTIFSDDPMLFSSKFFLWKEQKTPKKIRGPKDRRRIKELETVSLFEVTKTSLETMEALEFEINSPELGEIVGDKLSDLMQALNYWNWAYLKSHLASNLWKK